MSHEGESTFVYSPLGSRQAAWTLCPPMMGSIIFKGGGAITLEEKTIMYLFGALLSVSFIAVYVFLIVKKNHSCEEKKVVASRSSRAIFQKLICHVYTGAQDPAYKCASPQLYSRYYICCAVQNV